MTNQQHPAQFDWATELLDAQGHVTLSEQEAHEIGARLRRLHSENETLRVERERNLDSIRVNNEIINKKNAELESLRTGYAAARMEIESLQARIKTMAEEHADELMVAHLDGRARAAQPAGAQHPGTAYADLMQEASDWICEHVDNGTPGAMMWAIRLQSAAQKLRASHVQAPAQPAPVCGSPAGLPPLPDPDLRDVGTTPGGIKEFLRGYATEYAKAALASSAPADSVPEDAARLDWLALAGPTSICVVIDREHDGEVEVSTDDVTGYGKTLREALDAARKQGANHD